MTASPAETPPSPPAGGSSTIPPPPVSPATTAPKIGSPAPPAPPAVPIPPREGEVVDRGANRHDSIRAQRWTASGATKVLGAVDVAEANLSGMVSVHGPLKADRLDASGLFEVDGPVAVVGRLHSAGDARMGGRVEAGELLSDGHCIVAGPLVVHGELRWSDHLEARGDVTSGSVRFDGKMTLVGDLVANSIDGLLRDVSSARSFRAPTVNLRRHASLLGKKGVLNLIRIDASEVSLEGVVCQYVKADRIRLGADCHIAAYSGEIVHRHPSARVGPESTSPPPHGLWR